MSDQGYTTAILLAAGESTRLGRPKQLLPWNGLTLLNSTVNRLAMAGCERIIVVLGAFESEIRESCIAPANVRFDIVTNGNWSAGQSTSLRVGIESVVAMPGAGAIVIALCDQPLIGVSHYRLLLQGVCQHGYLAVGTDYPEGLGVPACFSLSALMSLSVSVGNIGAKKWLRDQSPDIVGRVKCPAAVMDIDTEADYRKRLNNSEFKKCEL